MLATTRSALKTSAVLARMAIARGGDRGVAAGGRRDAQGGFGILQQGGLIVLQLDNGMRLLQAGLEGFFWQCSASKRDGAVRDLEFAKQLLGG